MDKFELAELMGRIEIGHCFGASQTETFGWRFLVYLGILKF